MTLDGQIARLARDAAREAVREELRAETRMISQRTAEAILGLPTRSFLDLLRRPDCPLRVRRVGKLRLVELEPMLAWLDVIGLAAEADDNTPDAPVDDDARLLAELGLEAVH